MTVPCPACKLELDEAEFFGACSAFASQLRTVRWSCPACGGAEDLQLENGAVWFGYIGAAGAPYFAAMTEKKVAGLSVSDEPGALVIEHGGRRWAVPAV